MAKDLLDASTTYQATIRKGEIREAQRILLRLGQKHFGPTSPETESKLFATLDRDRLERMILRHSRVATWHELLATP